MESLVTSFELLQELGALLVEDNPADADLVREALAETGVALDHVTRIDDALCRSSNPPDLILLDLGLPDACGLDGLQRLHEAMPSVPIIILTGLGGHSIGMAAVRTGAEDFLTKSEITAFALRRVMCYAVERIRSRAARPTLRGGTARARGSSTRERFKGSVSGCAVARAPQPAGGSTVCG